MDDEFQLIVGNALTNNASDNGELIGLVTGVERTLAKVPEAVLADTGYRNESSLVELERCQVDGYVSLGREG